MSLLNVNHLAFNKESIEAISHFKREPVWMRDLRMAAWDRYMAQKPLQTLEGISLDALLPFLEPPKTAVPSHEWPRDLQQALEERGDEEGLIVQRDCTVLSKSISKEQTKRGVIFTNLSTAVHAYPDLVRRLFGQLSTQQTAEQALHMAFWNGGTFLYVPANIDVSLPFHTCYWLSTPGTALFLHTLVWAERSSHVSFVDEYLSTDWAKPALASAAAEIGVSQGSRVNYIHLQNWGSSVAHQRQEYPSVAAAGRLYSFRVEMGGQKRLNRIETALIEAHRSQIVTATDLREGPALEEALHDLPIESMKEKLRHCIAGKKTGHRPVLTLEKVAQLHPEVRL